MNGACRNCLARDICCIELKDVPLDPVCIRGVCDT